MDKNHDILNKIITKRKSRLEKYITSILDPYLINDVNYFSNGIKITYELKNNENKIKYRQKYTCNDPEFKKTRSGSTVKQLKTPSDAELDAVLGKL